MQVSLIWYFIHSSECLHDIDATITDDDSHGQFFHSKYHPNLKFFVQTGHDIERGMGCWCIILLLSSTMLNSIISGIDESYPTILVLINNSLNTLFFSITIISKSRNQFQYVITSTLKHHHHRHRHHHLIKNKWGTLVTNPGEVFHLPLCFLIWVIKYS